MKIEIIEIISEIGDFDLQVGQIYDTVEEHGDGDVEIVLASGHQVTIFQGEYKVVEE